MNTMKKAFALVLVLAMVMSLGITAFAGDAATPTYTITITNPAYSGVTMNGATFTAYKIFKATYDKPNDAGAKFTYEVTPEFAEFKYAIPTDLQAQFDGATEATGADLPKLVAALEGNIPELTKFAEAALAYAKTHTAVGDKSSTSTFTANDDKSETVKITAPDAGYYVVDCPALVSSSTVNSVALTTTHPNAEFVLKVGQPTLDKNVAGATDTGVDDVHTAEVGKDLTFTLDTVVPNMSGYDKFYYEFKDTMSKGLTFNAESLKVEIFGRKANGTAADTAKATIAAAKYTVASATDEQGVTSLSVQFTDLKAVLADTAYASVKSGDIMRVSYTAKLNGDALTIDAATNVADLTYSNDPKVNDFTPAPGTNTVPGTDKTPEDTVKLYTLDLDIDKFAMVDDPDKPGEQKEQKLADAKFVLYKEVVSGGSTTLQFYTYAANKVTWVAAESAKDAVEKKGVTEYVTVEDGKLNQQFQGLEEGTYYLVETAAPQGYETPKDAIKVAIKANPKIGNPVNDITGFKLTYGYKSAAENLYTGDVNLPDANGHMELSAKIQNTSGKILPETGGMGTTIFYTVGAIMMVSALALLITKKKMSVN